MIFTEDNLPTQKETINPEWNYIVSSLKNIDPLKKAFFILANDTSSYIQCTGDRERLCIELREINDNQFKHFVLGKPQNKNSLTTVWTEIYSRVGPIHIHENEVFNLADAIIIFELFYQGIDVPNTYCKRNVSKLFK